METRSIKKVPMKEIKVYSNRMEDDNRRYAYEKAIEAYWKHVDRYHTWMNYYAIFNGALFVGLSTLLTATTTIKSDCEGSYQLTNNYVFVAVMVCFLGFVASCCWRRSIKGHLYWEENWLNIIIYYEKEFYCLYNLLITDKRNMIVMDNKSHELKENEMFKAYSTHKVTMYFINQIIVAWSISIPVVLYLYRDIVLPNINILFTFPYILILTTYLLIFIIVVKGIIILILSNLMSESKLYSNVNKKYWIPK